MFTVYLAGPTSQVQENRKIGFMLEAALPVRVLIPHDYVICAKESEAVMWEAVYSKCRALIDIADAVVVNLSEYGRDTAAETGYAHGRGIPTIGFLPNNGALSDPIVRGCLRHLAGSNVMLLDTVRELIAPLQSVPLAAWAADTYYRSME